MNSTTHVLSSVITAVLFQHCVFHFSPRYPRFLFLSGIASLPLAEATDGVEGALLPVGALPLQVPHVGVVSETFHHLLGEQVVDEGGVQGTVVVHQMVPERIQHMLRLRVGLHVLVRKGLG